MSVRTIESGGLQLANISSSPGLIRIQSGFVKEEQLTQRMRQGVFNGVVAGVNKAFDIWSPSIALKTGRMRKAIRAMINQHVNAQVGSSVITIDLATIVSLASQLIEYTRHHYQVMARTGLPFYKRPTTGGTKPFTNEDFARIFPPVLESEIRKALRSQGFELGSGTSFSAGFSTGPGLAIIGVLGVGVIASIIRTNKDRRSNQNG